MLSVDLCIENEKGLYFGSCPGDYLYCVSQIFTRWRRKGGARMGQPTDGGVVSALSRMRDWDHATLRSSSL